MSRFSLWLLTATLGCALLAGCNENTPPETPADPSAPDPDIVIAPGTTPLSVPAYPMGFVDVSNTVWESCRYDSADDSYVRRRWSFVVTDASVSQFRHGAADSSCSGSSTRDWLYDFDNIVDEGGSAAYGWVNAAGTATKGGGAPASLDGLGNLPGQPLARRSKFVLQAFFTGRAPYPYGSSLMSSTRLLLFVDASAAPNRLYVGSVAKTLDVDGYPVFLESATGLTRQ